MDGSESIGRVRSWWLGKVKREWMRKDFIRILQQNTRKKSKEIKREIGEKKN